jgi:hypothetical protein
MSGTGQGLLQSNPGERWAHGGANCYDAVAAVTAVAAEDLLLLSSSTAA